jgi:hypothetical protein
MSSDAASRILESLSIVRTERTQWLLDPSWAARVASLKHYQSERFRATYADLLSSSRYAPASRFFLEELYGPQDFNLRDEEFASVVPALVRLFPSEIIDTASTLATLHALSESLDGAMGRAIEPRVQLTPARYAVAWKRVGRQPDRDQQIALTLAVGKDLDRLTHRQWLRRTLRLMRRPAQLAGLSRLQQFLESGFDAFAAMRGAAEFLAIIESRERALANALFLADVDRDSPQIRNGPMAWLPMPRGATTPDQVDSNEKGPA